MSDYPFKPANLRREYPFATLKDAFSAKELDAIVTLGDQLIVPDELFGGDDGDASYRKCQIGWVLRHLNSEWLYERIAKVVQTINSEFYNFELYGLSEHLQFTVYNGRHQSHFGWHIDKLRSTATPRKLSLTIQLSDPADYEGGSLEIKNADVSMVASKRRGEVIAFPSWTLHRVTPVTKGIRKSLVVWVTGPQFK